VINHFKKQDRGIIFLADEFRVGTDIKCREDASVLVYITKDAKNDPDREDLL